jgi:hypothetical protein
VQTEKVSRKKNIALPKSMEIRLKDWPARIAFRTWLDSSRAVSQCHVRVLQVWRLAEVRVSERRDHGKKRRDYSSRLEERTGELAVLATLAPLLPNLMAEIPLCRFKIATRELTCRARRQYTGSQSIPPKLTPRLEQQLCGASLANPVKICATVI